MQWATIAAAAASFLVMDLVYALDHYFVHHDKKRYAETHARHHRRYNGKRSGPQLDGYELSTYTSAAIMSLMPTGVLMLLTGNPGFVIGAVLKYAHTLLFHLYQHRWWGETALRKQQLGRPVRTWGIASARYHAFHHSDPDDRLFTYAETWAGFDRLLEWAHPWLVRYTADGGGKRELALERERGIA